MLGGRRSFSVRGMRGSATVLAAAASVFGGKTEPEIIKQSNAFACKSKVCHAVKLITNRKRRRRKIIHSDCQNQIEKRRVIDE
jgi:hypothetical protein